MSVFKRLREHREVQAELSIRFWHQEDNFKQFSIIQIATCSTYKQAWVMEHILIDQCQQKLNFPFIQIFLKRTALGFRPGRRRRWTEFGRFGL